MVDVSTVKELSRRWYSDVPRYPKKGAHLALDDILESIEELKYFRENVFVGQP
jgi:oligoribonuclease